MRSQSESANLAAANKSIRNTHVVVHMTIGCFICIITSTPLTLKLEARRADPNMYVDATVHLISPRLPLGSKEGVHCRSGGAAKLDATTKQTLPCEGYDDDEDDE